jgi:hypothetical protein
MFVLRDSVWRAARNKSRFLQDKADEWRTFLRNNTSGNRTHAHRRRMNLLMSVRYYHRICHSLWGFGFSRRREWWWLSPGMFLHPQDGGSKHLWNVGQFLPDYTAQHPRRQSSSQWLLTFISLTFSHYSWPKMCAHLHFNCSSQHKKRD